MLDLRRVLEDLTRHRILWRVVPEVGVRSEARSWRSGSRGLRLGGGERLAVCAAGPEVAVGWWFARLDQRLRSARVFARFNVPRLFRSFIARIGDALAAGD
ncbi:MAG: hypothetical protein C4334_15185 [Pyrinomonas sp.]